MTATALTAFLQNLKTMPVMQAACAADLDIGALHELRRKDSEFREAWIAAKLERVMPVAVKAKAVPQYGRLPSWGREAGGKKR